MKFKNNPVLHWFDHTSVWFPFRKIAPFLHSFSDLKIQTYIIICDLVNRVFRQAACLFSLWILIDFSWYFRLLWLAVVIKLVLMVCPLNVIILKIRKNYEIIIHPDEAINMTGRQNWITEVIRTYYVAWFSIYS